MEKKVNRKILFKYIFILILRQIIKLLVTMVIGFILFKELSNAVVFGVACVVVHDSVMRLIERSELLEFSESVEIFIEDYFEEHDEESRKTND